MMKRFYSTHVISLLLLLALAGSASADLRIGMLTDGSQSNATANLNYYVSKHPSDTFSAITPNSAFNSMSVATLAASYDVLIMPWYVNTSANLAWSSRILPYLEAGGSVLWEDPYNRFDLAGSGITFGSSSGYNSNITLVAPFNENGAVGYYHPHFGIVGYTSAWDAWSTDSGGHIHGVYGEFGTNGGRMVVAVSDNLYHPHMSSLSEADHYNLLVNELNWLDSGTVVPVPGAILLGILGLSVAGIKLRKSV